MHVVAQNGTQTHTHPLARTHAHIHSFPYASGYMLNGNGELPAFPVRVACRAIDDAANDTAGLMEGATHARVCSGGSDLWFVL